MLIRAQTTSLPILAQSLSAIFWRALCGKLLLHQGSGSQKIPELVKPPPSTQAQKKAPPPTGMVELLEKQIQTNVCHCNLFQWLNTVFTP